MGLGIKYSNNRPVSLAQYLSRLVRGEGSQPLHHHPFLIRVALHDPLREVLLLLRAAITTPCKRSSQLFWAAAHNTLKEILTPLQGCWLQYSERGPYSSSGLQITIPGKRSLLRLEGLDSWLPWQPIHSVSLYGNTSSLQIHSVLPVEETTQPKIVCLVKFVSQKLTGNPRKKRKGALNISFIAVGGPPPQCFNKPGRGEAHRSRVCSSPNPIAMSSILRGLKTRHGYKLPSFRGKSRFCEGGSRQILKKWTGCGIIV